MRTAWDVVTLACVLYTAIYMPYELAFPSEEDESQWRSTRVDLIQDFLFLIDIVLNFHTAYIREDATLEISKPLIARQYLTT